MLFRSRKLKAEAAKAEYLAKAAEAKAKAEAARAKAIEIKLAKEKAARARARAEAELKAKTERLNAKVREQALKEAIRAARRKNLSRFGCELAAKTEANEDEAEQIYATAVDVVNRVKAFNKSLTETDAGFKPEYIGCFKDPKRNDRDLPHIYKNYARTKKADCLAAAKKAEEEADRLAKAEQERQEKESAARRAKEEEQTLAKATLDLEEA